MLDPSHIISELKGTLRDKYLQKWNEELCNVSKMRKVIRVNCNGKLSVATFASADSTPKIQNKLPPIKG